MGRFITGDIDYKFMVAVQSSRAADRFGYLGETIFYEDEDTKESFPVEIHYNFDKNYLKYVEEELENIKIIYLIILKKSITSLIVEKFIQMKSWQNF